ncbi:sulfotransferase family protein [Lentisalinibacter sediminis]|uniref:sulfotransferase family protein n=1 Tax=Lentisalinibacter sediminis TaxID=2992237 RepID=UPI00386ECFA2
MSRAADLLGVAVEVTRGYDAQALERILSRPVIIVSAPRAGSTLVFEQLMRLPGFWSIGAESHGIYAAFPALRAENAALDSGALGERHADPATCDLMRRVFLTLLRDHRGRRWLALPESERPFAVNLLEKTPRNALNIPFLRRVFPEARFVFLHRRAESNIASLIEAWRVGLADGRFVTFRDLPGWDREAWCFLLPPGWRALRGRPLAAVAAFQWAAANNAILDALQSSRTDYTVVRYEALLAEPRRELGRISAWAGSEASVDSVPGTLPLSRTTLTPPRADKWRRHEQAIDAARPLWQSVAERLRSL